MHDQLSEPTGYASADEYEFMHEQVHIYLSRSIIRAWEDIKHKTSLIYENENITTPGSGGTNLLIGAHITFGISPPRVRFLDI